MDNLEEMTTTKMKEAIYKLIQDTNTIKEAFIIDELQSYMDLSDTSNPKWIKPVRVRLQEKKDWEQQFLSLEKATEEELREDVE